MRQNDHSFSRALRALTLTFFSILLLTPHAVFAVATVTNWTGQAGDALWTTSANWDNGVPVTNYAATFNGAGNADTSISLNGAAQPINTIAFTGAAAASYTIGVTPADALNFDAGGAISVASSVTTAQTISAAINASGALTLTNAGTNANGLTLGGAMSLGGTMTITNSGSTALTTLSGNISGSGGITPGGGGSIVFSGNNSYSGITNLSSGTATNIRIASDTAFGTSILQPNNGTNSPLQAFGADHTIANTVNFITGFTVNNAAQAHNLTFTGPLNFTSASGRTVTLNNTGQVVTFGASANSNFLTLSATGGINLSLNAANNAANTTPAVVVINDVIQDASPAPATPDTLSFNSTGNNTPQGTFIINGASTYAGSTTFNGQTSGTFVAQTTEIGVNTVGNPGSVTSGPFGKGTVIMNSSNAPPIFEPYGADRTVANALTLTSGFFAASAPTSGTGPMVDPGGTTHNLIFTGPISDPGKVITNNMAPGVAMYLGSAATSSIMTMTGSTKFQTQSTTAGAGTTIIYDQMTSTGSMVVQNKATVEIAGNTNNYSGATQVTSGAILLAINGSGSATGTGAVSAIGAATGAAAVGTGGVLGGNGFITGPITISATAAASQGGVISPGVTGPGTLAVGSMTWDPFGRYVFEYNQNDNTIDSGINDDISGSGTLDLTNLSSANPFDLNLTPVVTGSATQNYTMASFAGGILMGGSPIANGTDVSDLFTLSGTFPTTPSVLVVPSTNGTGQSLLLAFTPIPEPASLGLLGLTAVAALRRRR